MTGTWEGPAFRLLPEFSNSFFMQSIADSDYEVLTSDPTEDAFLPEHFLLPDDSRVETEEPQFDIFPFLEVIKHVVPPNLLQTSEGVDALTAMVHQIQSTLEPGFVRCKPTSEADLKNLERSYLVMKAVCAHPGIVASLSTEFAHFGNKIGPCFTSHLVQQFPTSC